MYDKGAEAELWLRENELPEEGGGRGAENDDADDEDEEEMEGTAEKRAQHAKKIRELDFFRSALAFITLMESVATTLEKFLRSRNSSDAIEALRFFVKASHFNLPCAGRGLRQSWSMVWSSDALVRMLPERLCRFTSPLRGMDAAATRKVASISTTWWQKPISLSIPVWRNCSGACQSVEDPASVYAALRKGAIVQA